MRPFAVFACLTLLTACDADAKRCLGGTGSADDERFAACQRACSERKNVDACEALDAMADERAGSSSLDALGKRLRGETLDTGGHDERERRKDTLDPRQPTGQPRGL